MAVAGVAEPCGFEGEEEEEQQRRRQRRTAQVARPEEEPMEQAAEQVVDIVVEEAAASADDCPFPTPRAVEAVAIAEAAAVHNSPARPLAAADKGSSKVRAVLAWEA